MASGLGDHPAVGRNVAARCCGLPVVIVTPGCVTGAIDLPHAARAPAATSAHGPSSATVLSATAAATSGGAFRISRFLRADPHFPCLLKITIFIQRGAAAGMKTSYENSRRYLSYCAFISAMNWMNSGACRMRFKKASCSNKG